MDTEQETDDPKTMILQKCVLSNPIRATTLAFQQELYL